MTFPSSLSELMAALTVTKMLTYVLANPAEVLGTLTGIAGALMLALNSRLSAWAWPVWIASNIAWIDYALQTHAYAFLVQQIVFTIINVVGMWLWLYKPKPKSIKAASCYGSAEKVPEFRQEPS